MWGPRAKRPPPARPDRSRGCARAGSKNGAYARMGNYPAGTDPRRDQSFTSPRHRDRVERKSSSLESSSSQCTRFVPPVRVNLRRARSGAVGAPGPRARPPEALGLSRGSRGERGRGSLLDGSRSARRRRVVARVRRRKRPATMGNAPSAQTVFKSFKQAFDKLFGNKEMRVVMLGLDAAGKTTILYKLHIGEVLSTVPTLGTTREGNLATCFPSTSREDRLGFGFSGRASRRVGEKEGSPPCCLSLF